MHVVERRMGGGQCLLPGGLAFGAAGRLDAAHRCGEIGLGAVPCDPAVAHLVLGEAFLQGRLGGVLEVRTDGGAHRGRCRGQVRDAGEGARFAAHMVEEIVAGIALDGVVIGDHLRQAALGGNLGRVAILLHPGEHIVEPLPGAVGMPVRAVIGRSLGQPGQRGAFGHRQR